MNSKDRMNETEKYLDSRLWHACAGSAVQMPPLNSEVFYFPQGHAEHAYDGVDFRNWRRVPAVIACRVSAIKLMADTETDEVFAKIGLVPLEIGEIVDWDEGICGLDTQEKIESCTKVLTDSDANCGGGFTVPGICAEKIFPRLDYSAAVPVQLLSVKDVQGKTWTFRHTHRGKPKRHLLTTGWSEFANHKKLIGGDSAVFFRAENGDIFFGVRRAKWGKDRVRAESVIKAVMLAANGQPFEVVYYPRAGTPEFCVKASRVRAALKINWCSGMRFRMAFETNDYSIMKWSTGTILSAQDADPITWPGSPWRFLEVKWDVVDSHKDLINISPWLVELPERSRELQPPDFPLEGRPDVPSFSRNPFSYPPINSPAGMQGARHARGNSYLSDRHLKKPQSGVFPASCLQPVNSSIPSSVSNSPIIRRPSIREDVSWLPTTRNSIQTSEKSDNRKAPQFVLFGQPRFTEQQISSSCSEDQMSLVCTENIFSDANADEMENISAGSGSAVHQHGISEHSSYEGSQGYKEHQQENDRTTITIRSPSPAIINDKPSGSLSQNTGNYPQNSWQFDSGIASHFFLFGQQILTEEQILLSQSLETTAPIVRSGKNSVRDADEVANTSDGSGSALDQPRRLELSLCDWLRGYQENHQESSASSKAGQQMLTKQQFLLSHSLETAAALVPSGKNSVRNADEMTNTSDGSGSVLDQQCRLELSLCDWLRGYQENNQESSVNSKTDKQILTEQQLLLSQSLKTPSPLVGSGKNLVRDTNEETNTSDGPGSALDQQRRPELSLCDWSRGYKENHQESSASSKTGYCKVLLVLERVSRDAGYIDLFLLQTYGDLFKKVENMSGIKSSELWFRLQYQDVTGAVKQIIDEPFRDFRKTARVLKILKNSSSNNVQKWKETSLSFPV